MKKFLNNKYLSKFLIVAIIICIFGIAFFIKKQKKEQTKSTYIKQQEKLYTENKDTLKEFHVSVKKGDSFFSILKEQKIADKEILAISEIISKLCKLSELKPDADKLVIQVIEDDKVNTKVVQKVEIHKSPIHKIVCFKTDKGFELAEEKNKVITQYKKKNGVILKGTSLIETALKNDIPYNVIDKFYEIFSFDIDFERDILPDDKFEVLYQELYADTSEYLGVGELVYANFKVARKPQPLSLYRFENDKGQILYYDENGKGASKAIKKTPINGAKISSGYGRRIHPVLGYSKNHRGVDFAAPMGTPIPAGGSGRVVARSWFGGYGRYVKIKHNGTYSTAYGHLSRFHPNVRVGSYVNQGQIIGYVGATGMATGPHLHYEIIKNGVQVNPFGVKLPSVNSLQGKNLENFQENKQQIDFQLKILEK